MKLLVFGKSGQVATELRARAHADIVVEALDRRAADLTDPSSCAERIANTDADAVINAAACTNVDGAETDAATCQVVNAEAPTAMARAAAQRGLPFLHISTDYVFDGAGTKAYEPNDPVSPINVYGLSKLNGEKGVKASQGHHLILRTAWVFSAHGSNFVKAMLGLAATRDRLNVVSDQIGGPTHAGSIADALIHIAQAMITGHPGGTFHFTGAPNVTRADFARAIFASAGLPVTVTDIATEAFPTPARRPLNSQLDCQTTWDTFDLAPPDWRAGLRNVIETIGAGDQA